MHRVYYELFNHNHFPRFKHMYKAVTEDIVYINLTYSVFVFDVLHIMHVSFAGKVIKYKVNECIEFIIHP